MIGLLPVIVLGYQSDLDQLYVSHVKLPYIIVQLLQRFNTKKEDISTIHDMYITEFECNVYKLPFNIMFTEVVEPMGPQSYLNCNTPPYKFYFWNKKIFKFNR